MVLVSLSVKVPFSYCFLVADPEGLWGRYSQEAMSHGHGSPRKGMSPTANTRDTRDRVIVSGTNTWMIPEDV
jgi:hypothetical protein